ncbi:murein transglycosylase A [Sneathiella limimaris]|uniref:murein transglycosylase A n=1 Tax=Sneathiella limimaris TaxID=1964213 RepID=UPI00146CCC63|nr:MltA domain-containing protein [Sneathiella limimaris]
MRSWERIWVTCLAGLVLLSGVGVWYFFYFEKEALEDQRILKISTYSDLPGWQTENFSGFMAALSKSCNKLSTLPDNRSLGAGGIAGAVSDWKPICEIALDLFDDPDQIRSFFESQMIPVQVLNNEDETGLFTGYYEASLKGSRTKSDRYHTPLYMRPDELVMVHLGRFRESLKGQRIAGLVKNGELYPFADRKEIDDGALAGRDLEIVWVDSAVDAFFLHIQGSGYVELDDGSSLRVGYAGQNGHPYYAIGKTLIESGAVLREDMSMQAIRSWLETNPDKAEALMQENASYIFFRELEKSGPVGAQGVELTPGRSLAVDRKWMPLGVPIWLATEAQEETTTADIGPIQRLFMAQDTGGAIRGPVRGDVFWGHGDEAYEKAGAMKSKGQYWMLLPIGVAERLKSQNNSSS